MTLSRRSMMSGLVAVGGVTLVGAGSAAPAPARSFAKAAERALRLDQLHALVIARGETVLFAEAFRGPAVDRPVNVKSVSKTIVALLTGIAVDRGVLPGPEATLGAVAPGLIPRNADPAVGDITVADLLTMQAGLERTSGPNYGRWVQSGDWVAHALTRPMVAEPGSRFLYSTGSFHILGAMLANATGRSLLALTRDWLGNPLDVEVPGWTRDPQGFYLGGNNMALSPLGLARVGQMILAGGRWKDRDVVSRDWIETSWQPRTRSPFSGHEYGYGWFLTAAAGYRVAYGRGYGGQMLFVVPDLAVCVAVTSDANRPARSHGYAGALHRLLAEDILPAVEA